MQVTADELASGYTDAQGVRRRYVVLTRLANGTYAVADPTDPDSPIGDELPTPGTGPR